MSHVDSDKACEQLLKATAADPSPLRDRLWLRVCTPVVRYDP
jgi:hypothetical protein